MSKPGKVLKGLCKKLGVRLTVKRGRKRIYKSVAVLKRQCKRKTKEKVKKKKKKVQKKKKKVQKKKKKVKRRRRFGTGGLGPLKTLPYQTVDNEGTYIGGRKNRRKHGLGIMKYHDGVVYTGEWKDGYEKKGKMIYNDGSEYDGEWEESEPHGYGIYKKKNDYVYEGNFTYGWREGKGKCKWVDGDVYEGYWKDDERHGKGTMKCKDDGTVYTGDFKNNKQHGKGKFIWQDGAKYEGELENDLFKGTGKYTFASGDVYEGNFENNKFEGAGKYTYTDGTVYIGNFENDFKSGTGIMKYADGSVYIGNWSKGKFNGKGELFNTKGAFDKKIQRGNWLYGTLVSGDIYTYKDTISERKFTHKIKTNFLNDDGVEDRTIISLPGYVNKALIEFQKISKPIISEGFGKRRKKVKRKRKKKKLKKK